MTTTFQWISKNISLQTQTNSQMLCLVTFFDQFCLKTGKNPVKFFFIQTKILENDYNLSVGIQKYLITNEQLNAMLSYVFMANFVYKQVKIREKYWFQTNKNPGKLLQHFGGYPKISNYQKIAKCYAQLCFCGQFVKQRQKSGKTLISNKKIRESNINVLTFEGVQKI